MKGVLNPREGEGVGGFKILVEGLAPASNGPVLQIQ